LESRIQILELKRSGTAVKATAELIVEVKLRPAFVEDNQSLPVINWPEEPTEKLSGQSTMLPPVQDGLLISEKFLFSRREAWSNVQIWFAELATGEVHTQANRKDVHCLVLLGCGENSSNFVG